MVKFFFATLFAFALSQKAQALPTYHNAYAQRCIDCHASAFSGTGLRNSAKTWYKSIFETTPTKSKDWKLEGSLRANATYATSSASNASADASALFFTADKNHHLSLELNSTYANENVDTSSTYFIKTALHKHLDLYFGKHQPITGSGDKYETLNISSTYLSRNEAHEAPEHGLIADIKYKDWSIAGQLLFGNIEESGKPESPEKILRLTKYGNQEFGISSMWKSTSFMPNLMSVYMRSFVAPGSTLMAETGVDYDYLDNDQYSFFLRSRSSFFIDQRFFFNTTIELATDNIGGPSARIIQLTPGLKYFPLPFVEVETNFYWRRYLGTDAVFNDRWGFSGGLSIWL